jgi:hypothetical protein
MSSTGYWFIGTAVPDTVERLRATLPVADFEPLPADSEQDWWRAMDDCELLAPLKPGYTYPGPSDAAYRFAETLESRRPDPDVRDACLYALEDTPKSEFFHVGVRKGDPVAALHYGLGYGDAYRLPGRFGCFLLAPDAVRTSLTRLEHLPEQPAVGRERFAERTAAWLEAVSDEPGLDPLTLLDGPLKVLRQAGEQHIGAIAFMQWF